MDNFSRTISLLMLSLLFYGEVTFSTTPPPVIALDIDDGNGLQMYRNKIRKIY